MLDPPAVPPAPIVELFSIVLPVIVNDPSFSIPPPEVAARLALTIAS